MSRESTLIFLGVLIALSPFIGLPYSWLMVILPILALALVLIAVALRAKRLMNREPLRAEPVAPTHEITAP